LEHAVSKVASTLFITNDFGPRAGGIETFLIGLIERIPRDKKTPFIVYTSAQENSADYDAQLAKNFGITVIRDKSKILLPTPRVISRAKKLVKSERSVNVVFGAAAPLAVMAPAMRRAGATNIVALTHGHEVWWAKIAPFNLAIRLIGNSVDHLTHLGDFTARAIAQGLSQDAKQKQIHIAPGIDVDHFSPKKASKKLRRSMGLENKQVIVSVGRLVHRKGQDRLISALPEIRACVPNVHLLLVGEGPYRSKLEKIARSMQVEDAVTFVGRINYQELPTYFLCGDIFAMPSRSRLGGLEVEGLGIVYLEASACGLPVIAGNSGGAPDAVQDGITGLVVSGNDVAEISRAAIALLNNPEAALAMGKAGRSWMVAHWQWKYWAAAFNALLK